jgi:hypothetical protein
MPRAPAFTKRASHLTTQCPNNVIARNIINCELVQYIKAQHSKESISTNSIPPSKEMKFIMIININLRCSKCREKTTDIVSSLTDAREHSSDLATYAVTFDLFFPASPQHNTCPGRAQFLIRVLLTTSNCHLFFLFQTRLRSIYKWKERIYITCNKKEQDLKLPHVNF